MKVLNYNKTTSGTMIFACMKDAKLNPLEISANAIAYVQGLDLFKSFQDKFDKHIELIQIMQQVKRPLDSPHITDGHSELTAMQAELIVLHKKYEYDNPVYLTPANSILVDSDRANSIEADLKGCTEGEYICLDMDDDGKGFKHSKLISAKVGKRYRLPDEGEWHTINEIDDKVPDNALYTAPDMAEAKIIEAKRIKGLAPEALEAEKAIAISSAENVFIAACQRADYLGGDNAETDKQAATTALTAAKKVIETSYKV